MGFIGHLSLDTTISGLGMAFALPIALEKQELNIDETDLLEINEASAAQVLG